MNIAHSLLLVAITSAVTFSLRAFPFVLFSGSRTMPPFLKKIADLLPASIISVLLIYCVKTDLYSISLMSIAPVIAIAGTVAIHWWKRNTLLSVAVGTILYMILIRIL